MHNGNLTVEREHGGERIRSKVCCSPLKRLHIKINLTSRTCTDLDGEGDGAGVSAYRTATSMWWPSPAAGARLRTGALTPSPGICGSEEDMERRPVRPLYRQIGEVSSEESLSNCRRREVVLGFPRGAPGIVFSVVVGERRSTLAKKKLH